MASNSSTPAQATFPVPPPLFNVPFVKNDGSGLLTAQAISFLQILWAAIQGSGGIVDLSLLFANPSGLTAATASGLIAQSDAVLLAPLPALPIPIGALLDSLGGNQGDILYRGAAGWTVLAPGTAGQVLQTNGAGMDPSWASASSAPATTFASLPATPSDGQRAFITDGSVVASGNFGAVAAGGGANHVPVYFDGGATNWKIG